MSDSQQSTGKSPTGVLIVIAGLLAAILVVLMNQDDHSEPAPGSVPTEDASEIDPVVEAQCRDLIAQMDNADERAAEATNAADQGTWMDAREDLDGRYLKVCGEYDAWARQSGEGPIP
ncbi:hypothetical protein WBG06_16930 [Nocardioides sp. CCNWLW239]|uniref:hypothetical protein n=1 Tax=Nocardioides sp. CCNWLW239 TaxID=3128902 RepID=UPI003017C82D